MTVIEKNSNKRKQRERSLHARSTSRPCVLLAALLLGAAGLHSAILFAQEAPAAAAPAAAESAATPEAAPAPPAEPTPEERQAALEQMGVESATEIPIPAEDPAGAAAFTERMNEALANPDPPEPEPSVAVELAPDFDPKKSYSRLLYPAVATRVGLSEEQSERVNEVMSQRAQRLGSAPKEEWNAITLESERALEAVLTPEQNERFKRGITEKTIAMRFSKERWADVLQWLPRMRSAISHERAASRHLYLQRQDAVRAERRARHSERLFEFQRVYVDSLQRYAHPSRFQDGHPPAPISPENYPDDLPNQQVRLRRATIPPERRNMIAVRTTIQPFMGPVLRPALPWGNLDGRRPVNALREIYAAASCRSITPIRRLKSERASFAAFRGPRGEGASAASGSPEWRDYELKEPRTIRSVLNEIFAPDAKPLYNPQSDTILPCASQRPQRHRQLAH